MKLKIFTYILFLSYSLSAQKFAVIENKGENTVHFDEKNPNSFVGILLNNLSQIPNFVLENNFQGVYTEKMLGDIGIQKESMLEFSLNPILTINRTLREDTWMVERTNQSLDVFLDSLKMNEDYTELFNIDSKVLESYWNNTTVGAMVRIYSPYYFDVRNLKALLIEEQDSVKWIHFVKSGPSGKNFISLSLTYHQIATTDCFSFWKILNEAESKPIIDSYKQQCIEVINHDDYIRWKSGTPNTFVYGLEIHGATFSELNCSVLSINYNLNPRASKIFDNYHSLAPTLPKTTINTIKETQKIGEPIQTYNYDSEDYLNVLKTNQTLSEYLDQYSYTDLNLIDRRDLEKWWNETKDGEIVRKTPQTIVIWAEVPKTQVAFAYKVKNDGVQYTDISDVYFFVESGSTKEAYLQINDGNSFSSESLMNQKIREVKLDTATPKNWHLFLNISTSTMQYSKLKSKLKLINDQTQF
jgi:hypothetical protein